MRNRKTRRRQRLQWKLMRSYLWVTLVSVLLVELLVASLWWLGASRPAPAPTEFVGQIKNLAPELRASLSQPSDTTRLASVLAALRPNDRVNMALTSPEGRVLACVPENWLAPDSQLPNREFAPLRDGFQKLPNGGLGASGEGGSTLALLPIENQNGRVTALLWARVNGPLHSSDFSRALVVTVLVSGVVVGIFGTIAGVGFGWVNARRLTQRFKTISAAANAWSRGDFAASVRDDSDDEIGELAGHLNLMATQLRELVALRERLGASEERERLARDLHDTVKQQLFATTMQLGAARVLLDSDLEAARARLLESERLAFGAQSELTALLEQLRPGSYQHRAVQRVSNVSLETALHNYLRDWGRRSDIEASFQAQQLPALPAPVQDALLRITQEALANIARHSGAAHARLQLRLTDKTLRLIIEDDGRGFIPEATKGGLGLHTMRERAEMLPGGSFTLHSVAGKGTRIEVCLTVSAAEARHD